MTRRSSRQAIFGNPIFFCSFDAVKTKILANISILMLSGIFTFCGDEAEPAESTLFAYSVGGITKNVQSINGMLQSEKHFDHEERSLKITVSNSVSQMVTIGISNWDFQNPPKDAIIEGEYDATFDIEGMDEANPNGECLELTGGNAGVTLCSGGFITYTLQGDVYTSTFDGSTEATIIITKCTKRKISGSFTAILENLSGEELTVSGTFKNVKYEVF
jgi:hypothetical protein